MRIYMKILLLSLLILSLFGCASTPPSTSITQAPVNDVSLAEVNKDYRSFIDSDVRWGGRVLKAVEVGTDEQKRLHLEVLEYALDKKGRPLETAKSGGRFIARLPQPYKKSRFYRTRWVTLSGIVSGVENYPLANGGGQELPVIDVIEQYAWREKYDDDDHFRYHHYWPRFYFRYGIGRYHHRSRSSIGVVYKPKVHHPRHR